MQEMQHEFIHFKKPMSFSITDACVWVIAWLLPGFYLKQVTQTLLIYEMIKILMFHQTVGRTKLPNIFKVLEMTRDKWYLLLMWMPLASCVGKDNHSDLMSIISFSWVKWSSVFRSYKSFQLQPTLIIFLW